ncbi:diguanylate cyclase domain-containing protein [Kineococcus gynurae]|uniref:Diguanylate cyclase domain-containing protein n=1 Tax=Kineococcus gynurae TaxID=452979 RepID=A0ABV5LVT8_9ACTN
MAGNRRWAGALTRPGAVVAFQFVVIVGFWCVQGRLELPRPPLPVALVLWGAANLSYAHPVQRWLAGPPGVDRGWLRLLVPAVLTAVALLPGGLNFLLPAICAVVGARWLHEESSRRTLATGILTIVLGTVLTPLAHVLPWTPVVLPLRLDLLVVTVMALMGVCAFYPLAREAAGRRAVEEALAAERRRRQAELEHAATHDELTGLLNRRGLGEALGRAAAQARPGQGLGLVYADLDGFKRVNDRHGHAAGDDLLVAVARRLRTVLPAGAVVARMGGDEFVALLPGLAAPAGLATVARAVEDALRAPVETGERRLRVGVSVGTVGTEVPQDGETLLRMADRAMYAVKHADAPVTLDLRDAHLVVPGAGVRPADGESSM